MGDFVGNYPSNDIFWARDLTIYSNKTFHFEVFTDTGGHWEQSGSIKFSGGKIQLLADSERLSFLPAALIPVKWDEQKFLVEEEMIVSFCKNIKEDNPNGSILGYFFVKDGIWDPTTQGQPVSPDGQVVCP